MKSTRIILHFILLFMNAGFILYTIQQQSLFELYYNLLTLLLTILYFVLEMPLFNRQ